MGNISLIKKRLSHWSYISRDLLEHDIINQVSDLADIVIKEGKTISEIQENVDDILADRERGYLSERQIMTLAMTIISEGIKGSDVTYKKIIKHLEEGREDNKDLIEEYNERYGNE